MKKEISDFDELLAFERAVVPESLLLYVAAPNGQSANSQQLLATKTKLFRGVPALEKQVWLHLKLVLQLVFPKWHGRKTQPKHLLTFCY